MEKVVNNYSIYHIHGNNKADLETMMRVVNIRYRHPFRNRRPHQNRVNKNSSVNRKHDYILKICLYHEDWKDLMRLKHIKKGENNSTYYYVES